MSGFIDVPRLNFKGVFPYTGVSGLVAAEDRGLDRESTDSPERKWSTRKTIPQAQ
jgi:hypothetical protein